MNKKEWRKNAEEQCAQIRQEFPQLPAVQIYAVIIKNKFNFEEARKELLQIK